MGNPFDLSDMEKAIGLSKVKRRLFADESVIDTVKKRKMSNPRRINSIPQAIEDYQKKHPYLKRLVFEKFYPQCQALNKQFLRHPSTGYVFDQRTKLLVGKCETMTAPIVELTPEEWQAVFERLVIAQYLYKNPLYQRKVFTTFFQKRVEIVKRHERLAFYIHEPSQIVFDLKTKKAVGRLVQNEVCPIDDPDSIAEVFGSSLQ